MFSFLDFISLQRTMPDNKWVADLKTVLQVAKARLDVREKKKTEQVAKERYTVADYVRNNKVPRARIGIDLLYLSKTRTIHLTWSCFSCRTSCP